jgi:type I restriction enzyme S subunit
VSFPRYPKYKNSGVDWLGEVPEEWDVTPLKYLVHLHSGGTPSKENLTYWNGTIPWASAKDLKRDRLFDTEDHITQAAVDDGGATLVSRGSVLVVVRGMILARMFPVATAMVPMAINQDLKAIVPTARIQPNFLVWLLHGSSAETLTPS